MHIRCKRQANHACGTDSGVSTWSLPKQICSFYIISSDDNGAGFLLIFDIVDLNRSQPDTFNCVFT